MKKLISKNIQKIKPYIQGKPIEEVKRELGIKGPVIKMASNENAFSPSRKVISAIRKQLKNLNRYPDGGCFYLKKAIASKLHVYSSNIIVGNGSDELIVLALRAFTNKGDEVCSPFNGWGTEGVVSILNDRKYHGVELKKQYFDTSIVNLRNAEINKSQLTIFK